MASDLCPQFAYAAQTGGQAYMSSRESTVCIKTNANMVWVYKFYHKSDRKDEQLFLSNMFSPVSDLIHTVDSHSEGNEIIHS